MIGTSELLVILCVVLILFGGKRLPELAKSIGIGIRELKKACHGLDDEIDTHLNRSAVKKDDDESVVLDVKSETLDSHGK